MSHFVTVTVRKAGHDITGITGVYHSEQEAIDALQKPNNVYYEAIVEIGQEITPCELCGVNDYDKKAEFLSVMWSIPKEYRNHCPNCGRGIIWRGL